MSVHYSVTATGQHPHIGSRAAPYGTVMAFLFHQGPSTALSTAPRVSRRRALVRTGIAGLAALPLMEAASAASPPAALEPPALARIVEGLLQAKVDAINPSPVAGLYEVVLGERVVYVDATERYLFDGHLVEAATRTSLTARRMAELERANTPALAWERLDFADAIRTVYGKEVPVRALLTFEDPRCGFCRRLHQTLATIPDLVVYTFPVSFLGAPSRQANEAIWCAEDRSKAWDLAMKGLTVPAPPSQCDLGALERNMALARRYRVAGTPTIYTVRGQRIDGAVDAEVLTRALTVD